MVALALFFKPVLNRIRLRHDTRSPAVLDATDEKSAALVRVLLFCVPLDFFDESGAELYNFNSPQNSSLR